MEKRSMRKLLSWALVLTMLLTMLPASVLAAEAGTGEAAASEDSAELFAISHLEFSFEETADATKKVTERLSYLHDSELVWGMFFTVIFERYAEFQAVFDDPAAESVWIECIEAYQAETGGSTGAWAAFCDTYSGSVTGDLEVLLTDLDTTIGDLAAGQAYTLTYDKYTVTMTRETISTGGGGAGPVQPENEFAGGEGTEECPYLIETAEHLDNVRNYLDAHFKMEADIVFTEADFAEGGAFYNDGALWQPIGDEIIPFTGSFDGDGHAITGLKQDISAEENAFGGLFGCVSGATIENLGMVDSDISIATTSYYAYVGAIAGYESGGGISNCYNTGTVEATSASAPLFDEQYGNYHAYVYVGGIVGCASGAISNCYNAGTVKANAVLSASSADVNEYASSYAGGIAGRQESEISGCYNTGTVEAAAPSSAYAGGISGQQWGTIRTCYNMGEIQVTSSNQDAGAGGISGMVLMASITDCYNEGKVTVLASAKYVRAGGIAGEAEHTIERCYNTGEIKAPSSATYAEVGGIVGLIWHGKVLKCYSTGAVTAEASLKAFAGGVAGNCWDHGAIADCYNIGAVTAVVSSSAVAAYAGGVAAWAEQRETISNCYSAGTVSATTASSSSVCAYVGGIIGDMIDSTVTNCYYLNPGTGAGASCTVDQLMLQETFGGFDFTSVWTMAGNEDYLYPELVDVEMIFTKKAESIAVTTHPSKLAYKEAVDALDTTGGKITLYYNNGESEEVLLSADMVTGFDNVIVGKQTLTVTYKGFTDTFEIEILETPIQLSATSNIVNGHIVLFVKSNKEISAQVLHIALYSEVGQMLDYIIVPTVEPFATTNVVFDDDAAVKTAKVFLWDSLSTTTPITDAVEVTIR